MARHEANRENLMQEATALIERLALGNDQGEEIVIGFRRDGSASVYVNQDPAWHFNRHGQLRRAYERGTLIKAMAKKLFRMHRVRQPHEVILVSQEMSAEEQDAWLADVARHAAHILRQWRQGLLKLRECIPADERVAGRAEQLLAEISRGVSVAETPSVREG